MSDAEPVTVVVTGDNSVVRAASRDPRHPGTGIRPTGGAADGRQAAGRMRLILIAVAGLAAVAGLSWCVAWLLGWQGFAFAWTVHFLLMAWMAVTLDLAQPRLTSRWFRVRHGEARIYRRLGAFWFMRLLRRIGWERAMRARRSFRGTRSTLAGLDRDSRMSEFGHLILTGASLVMAAVAASFEAWGAMAWQLGLATVLHIYPVMLQRAMRARIARISH